MWSSLLQCEAGWAAVGWGRVAWGREGRQWIELHDVGRLCRGELHLYDGGGVERGRVNKGGLR